MNTHHTAHMQWMVDAVLTSPGETSPTLRQAVGKWVAELGIDPAAQSSEVPPELVSYIRKVALHAYKVTDEDIEALRNAGFSEDVIYEITVSVAVCAGKVRLERGLAALKGER